MSRESLLPALRQYRHNSGDDTLIPGYDYDETNRIVEAIWQELLKALHGNDELGNALSGAHAEAIRLSGQVKYWQDLAVANRKVAEKAQGEKPKARREFLTLAEACGAVITGKPDGSEPVSVVFTPTAWQAFDAAVLKSAGGN